MRPDDLANGELDRVVERIDAAPKAPNNSDDDLALRFASRHVGELRYVDEWSRWMVWNGKAWEPDNTMFAFHLARTVCREAASTCNDKDAKAIASAKTEAAVVALAKTDRRLVATAAQWDAAADLFNTPHKDTDG
jgi:putative DNA primase/helicase